MESGSGTSPNAKISAIRRRVRSTLGSIHFATLDDERKLRFRPRRAEGGFAVTAIDFRADPATARRYRIVSLVTHADIPDIVWADDETDCYGVQAEMLKANQSLWSGSGRSGSSR
jgi:hypothetical protein